MSFSICGGFDSAGRSAARTTWRARFHEGIMVWVGKKNRSTHGNRPEIGHNESRVDDERELLCVAPSFRGYITQRKIVCYEPGIRRRESDGAT